MAQKSSSHEKSDFGVAGERRGIECDGVEVHCKYDELKSAADLMGNPLNVKTHPKKQLAKYRQVVEALGWRAAVVVSSRSGMIVKGHGAVIMAQEWGKRVPVVYQDFADEAAELEFLSADNFLPEMGGTDRTKLRALLGRLQSLDAELSLTAVPDDDIRHLVATLQKEEFVLPDHLAGTDEDESPAEQTDTAPPPPPPPSSKPGSNKQLVTLVMPMPLFVKWKQCKDSFKLTDDLKVFTKLIETHLENIS